MFSRLFLTGKMRLHSKLMLLLILLTIIPMLILSGVLYTQQMRFINTTVSDSTQRELAQLTDRINSIFSQAISTSNLFYLDTEVNELLNQNPTEPQKIIEKNVKLNALMRKHSSNISGINYSIALLDVNGNAYGNALYLNGISLEEFKKRPWYQQFNISSFNTIWTTDSYLDQFFTSSNNPCIYIIRQIKNFSDWKPVGFLVLSISENQLKKSYMGYVNDYQNLYIINNEQILSSMDNVGLGDAFVPNYSSFSTFSPGRYKLRISGDDYLVSYNVLTIPKWNIVTYTRLNSLYQPFFPTQSFFMIVVCLCVLITCLLSYKLSKQFLSPLNELHRTIGKVKDGNLNVRAKVDTYDEIGELALQFNSMIDRVELLMNDIVVEQEAKRKMEMLSLQAQINPHFIYNTLASVRYMIYSGDKDNAQAVILSLIKIMKNTVSDPEQMITIEKELDLLNSYVFIQQFTFDEPIHFEIEVEDDIKKCMILKLILQPIVENAIMHGLKPKKGEKSLKIKGYKNNDIVEFQIIDNGVGFDMNHTTIRDEESDMQSGIGITNVQNRLHLHFVAGSGLQIESQPQNGTIVTIRFPFLKRRRNL